LDEALKRVISPPLMAQTKELKSREATWLTTNKAKRRETKNESPLDGGQQAWSNLSLGTRAEEAALIGKETGHEPGGRPRKGHSLRNHGRGECTKGASKEQVRRDGRRKVALPGAQNKRARGEKKGKKNFNF